VLRREKGVLTLRVNLVQKAIQLEKPRQCVGLMATPAKPMPKDWRKARSHHLHQLSEYRLEWRGSTGIGSGFSAKYRDMVISRSSSGFVTSARRAVRPRKFLKEWRKRNARPEQGYGHYKKEPLLGLLQVTLNLGGAARGSPASLQRLLGGISFHQSAP